MKRERGAIALFVLVALLFFTVALMNIYILTANRLQTQEQIAEETEKIHGKYVDNLSDLYDSYFSGEIIPIYTKEQLLKIGTGKNIVIGEEGGKIYTFEETGTYILKNDIEFSEIEDGFETSWIPIGKQIEEDLFTGTFVGNDHVIIVQNLEGRTYKFSKENKFNYVLEEVPELTLEFAYTANLETYIIETTGKYRLEVWGAQGGGNTAVGGKGGYSTGELWLTEGTSLYIYVGGKGSDSGQYGTGGFNGGGSYTYNSAWIGGTASANGTKTNKTTASDGGGATDIRIETNSLYARVIVAGGGGRWRHCSRWSRWTE